MWPLTSLLGRVLASWKSAQGLDSIAASAGANTSAPKSIDPDINAAELFQRPGRKLLHVGCGPATKASTGPGFQSDDWQEIRLDIDPGAQPDILGTLLDMSDVPDASVDAVFTSHTLEHLYAHEIPLALAEMRRVLRKDGIALSTVPDLQAAAKMIADDRMFEVAYQSPAGPITPFDIVYSYRGFVGRDRPYMAHHSGFTLTTLVQAFKDAGFRGVIGIRGDFTLWVLATELPQSEETLRRLAAEFVPITSAPDVNVAELFQRPGRKLLHVGCGHATKAGTCPGFQSDDWLEIRIDIDPAAVPDVVCSMLDMAPVPMASVDAVYSSHNIEHLYPHEVARALAEFLRVLKPGGFLVLTCPDLQSVCQLVVNDRLTEPAYVSAVGPIAPLDILYGHRPQLAAGNLFMAHHSGFTLTTLEQACKDAGFRSVIGVHRESYLDLWVLAMESPQSDETLRHLAAEFVPGVSNV